MSGSIKQKDDILIASFLVKIQFLWTTEKETILIPINSCEFQSLIWIFVFYIFISFSFSLIAAYHTTIITAKTYSILFRMLLIFCGSISLNIQALIVSPYTEKKKKKNTKGKKFKSMLGNMIYMWGWDLGTWKKIWIIIVSIVNQCNSLQTPNVKPWRSYSRRVSSASGHQGSNRKVP